MGDEFLSGKDALDGRLSLLVRNVRDKHAVVRALPHSDHVLATETTEAVLERQQKAALVAQLCAAITVAGRENEGDREDDVRAPSGQEQLVLRRLNNPHHSLCFNKIRDNRMVVELS